MVWDCSHCDFWWSFEAVLAGVDVAIRCALMGFFSLHLAALVGVGAGCDEQILVELGD